jgi:uncharacterized protein
LLVKRDIYDSLFAGLDEPQITILIGPRQVGKSTLLSEIAKNSSKKYKFLNLEDPMDLAVFSEGFNSFRTLIKENLVFIDEFHYFSNISSVFKASYDLEKRKIFASGSSSMEIHKHLKESLAGRKNEFRIYPFSFREFLRQYSIDLSHSVEVLEPHFKAEIKKCFLEFIKYGGLPGLVSINLKNLEDEKKEIKTQEYLYNIYKTYIAKDIRSFLAEEDILSFNKFIEYSIINDSQVLVLTNVAKALNISERQIKKQYELMLETYILGELRPFYTNKNKEISKAPKTFFYDLGIGNAIMRDFRDFDKRVDQSKGAILENFVYWELMKNIDIRFQLYYWRSYDDQEVDFVLKRNEKIFPIEVKSSWQKEKIPKGLKSFLRNYPETPMAFVLCDDFYPAIIYKETEIKFIPYYLAASLFKYFSKQT